MRITLPFPPSVNRLWRSGRGRVYRSAEYVAWLKAADAEWMAQKKGPVRTIEGAYELKIALFPRDNRRLDADNLLKAPQDFLQRVNIVSDDRYCRRLTAEWGGTSSSPYCVLEVVEC